MCVLECTGQHPAYHVALRCAYELRLYRALVGGIPAYRQAGKPASDGPCFVLAARCIDAIMNIFRKRRPWNPSLRLQQE